MINRVLRDGASIDEDDLNFSKCVDTIDINGYQIKRLKDC